MNDCEKIIGMLSAYFDGELTNADTELVRAHLDACEPCAALLRLFGEVADTLSDAEPPPELRERVMKSVSETAPLRVINTKRILLRRIIPAAACLAVVLTALSILRNSGLKTDSPAQSESAYYTESAYMAAAAPEAAPRDAAGGDMLLHGEIQENLRFDIAAPEEEGVYDDADAAREAESFAAGADVNTQSGAMPSTEPMAPEGGAIAAETPPPELPVTGGTSGAGTDGGAASIEDFSGYYAVIKLLGDAPDSLEEYVRLDTGAGGLRIYVPREVAETLIAEGYDYVLYDEDAREAVVILFNSGGG